MQSEAELTLLGRGRSSEVRHSGGAGAASTSIERWMSEEQLPLRLKDSDREELKELYVKFSLLDFRKGKRCPAQN